jgi:chorismate mutase
MSSTLLKRRQKIAREIAIVKTNKTRSIHNSPVMFFPRI